MSDDPLAWWLGRRDEVSFVAFEGLTAVEALERRLVVPVAVLESYAAKLLALERRCHQRERG